MSTVYEEIGDEEKAIGRVLKDERRLRGELAQLEEEVAGPLADRLRILTEIVAEERKGSVNPDRAGVVFCQGQVKTPVLYPSEQEIVDLLTKRVQIKEALQQAHDFLEAKVPRPRPVQD